MARLISGVQRCAVAASFLAVRASKPDTPEAFPVLRRIHGQHSEEMCKSCMYLHRAGEGKVL